MKSVRIATPRGLKRVYADRVEDGLAIALMADPLGYWTITHVGSGRRVGPAIRDLANARVLFEALLLLGDWRCREQDVLLRNEELRERVRLVMWEAVEEFEGCDWDGVTQ